jgi:hypothetical protein
VLRRHHIATNVGVKEPNHVFSKRVPKRKYCSCKSGVYTNYRVVSVMGIFQQLSDFAPARSTTNR